MFRNDRQRLTVDEIEKHVFVHHDVLLPLENAECHVIDRKYDLDAKADQGQSDSDTVLILLLKVEVNLLLF